MTPVEILKGARAKLAPPGAWTQGAYARDADGEVCEPDSAEASCFCVLGSIYAASKASPQGPWPMEVNFAIAQFRTANARLMNATAGCGQLPHFNDQTSRTHADILAAFDRAIQRAEAKP